MLDSFFIACAQTLLFPLVQEMGDICVQATSFSPHILICQWKTPYEFMLH